MITLELPFPPSLNNYWGERIVYSKKHKKNMSMKFIDTKGKAFRKAVMEQCMIQRLINKQLDGPLQYRLWLYPPWNRKVWDIDNYRKALLDAISSKHDKHGGLITAGVIQDDSQFEHDEAWKMHKVPGGKAVIEIERYSNPQSAHAQIGLLETA